MSQMDELKRKRFQFLNRLYEKSGGDTLQRFNALDLGKELGFSKDEVDNILQYLYTEKLVEAYHYSIKIKHEGIKAIENALSHPEEPSRSDKITAMNNLDELQDYKDKIEAFSNRFVEQAGDLFLTAVDAGIFKQTVLEVIDLLNDEFGENNRYVHEINHTIEKRSFPYDGSPTFECVNQIAAIIGAAHTQSKRKRANSSINQATIRHDDSVDISRLNELKSIGKERYDLSRLIRLCEELNIANQNDSYLSMAMLMRAIIDHVPPIFDATKFSEVASNYKSAKSFKDSMAHLESSLRKIADSHLHVQIRKREVLPTFSQVNYSADLDVLLSEIVRILK